MSCLFPWYPVQGSAPARSCLLLGEAEIVPQADPIPRLLSRIPWSPGQGPWRWLLTVVLDPCLVPRIVDGPRSHSDLGTLQLVGCTL